MRSAEKNKSEQWWADTETGSLQPDAAETEADTVEQSEDMQRWLDELAAELSASHREAGDLLVTGPQEVHAIDEEFGLSEAEARVMHRETGVLSKLHQLRATALDAVLTAGYVAKDFFVQPIANGEVFDSDAAMQQLREAPREQRPQLIRELKAKLAYQQRGLGQMREALRQMVDRTQRVDARELSGMVEIYAKKYGFDGFTQDIIEGSLNNLESRYHDIQKYTEQYSTGPEFFRWMFQGDSPQGEVELHVTPFTIYLRCHDMRDYTRMYHYGDVTDRLTEHDFDVAAQSGGCQLHRAPVLDLEGAITVENASDNQNDPYAAQRVLAHEEQHAINSVTTSFILPHSSERAGRRMMKGMDDEALAITIRRELRHAREHGVYRAKDEILAYIKEGRDLDEVYSTLTQKKADGGLYDYFNDDKIRMAEDYGEILPAERLAIFKDALDDVLEREYYQIILNGLRACRTLRDHGMNSERIIGTVGHEPLERWPHIASRIKQQSISRIGTDVFDDIQLSVLRARRRRELFSERKR